MRIKDILIIVSASASAHYSIFVNFKLVIFIEVRVEISQKPNPLLRKYQSPFYASSFIRMDTTPFF